MLFTFWSNADAYSAWNVDKGTPSMWVKIGCEWACALLYLWIICAPGMPSLQTGRSGKRLTRPAVRAVMFSGRDFDRSHQYT